MIKDLDRQILEYCRFCNPQEKERILYESDNFYLMLSLGPIVEGYCLLISKEHYSCCAAISSGLIAEFKEIYLKVKSILIEEYGSCICYEHGRAGACLIPMEGNKHCFHAHMHFVPMATDLNYLVQRDYDEVTLDSLDSFFEVYTTNNSKPYLYVEDSNSKNIYFIDTVIRRQYLRHKAAVSIEKENLWNWIEHQGWDSINSALKVLPRHFKKL